MLFCRVSHYSAVYIFIIYLPLYLLQAGSRLIMQASRDLGLWDRSRSVRTFPFSLKTPCVARCTGRLSQSAERQHIVQFVRVSGLTRGSRDWKFRTWEFGLRGRGLLISIFCVPICSATGHGKYQQRALGQNKVADAGVTWRIGLGFRVISDPKP